MPEIVHSKDLFFKTLGFTHRVGEPSFKYLFKGFPNTPNNYLFALALQRTFYSPVHKHNFEQFRYAHKGSFSISPTLTINEGEICYHPEGVEYGPQEDKGEEEKVLLILQFGGVSGGGYLEYETILKTQKEMIAQGKGTFSGGRFYANARDGDGAGEEGKERRGEGVDGFQAVWEEANHRLMSYPAPRYEAPVLIKPQNYGWAKIGEGVWRKHLGAFTERATRVEMWRVEKGEWRIEGEDATQLGFVVEGKGKLDGEVLGFEDAFRLGPGEGAVLKAEERVEVLRIVVPVID